MLGVPTMMLDVHTQYVANPSRWNISSFRGGTMGGSPCPPALMEKMMKDLNMKEIAIGFGMTETSPVSACTRLEDDVFHRCHTVGKVMEHTEIKIVDEKTRKTVPVGATGELCTKGYLVMLGYWNQENKTKESIDKDGWMR